ncbi:hypothetical protein JS278_02706 [Acidipropionibacterium virtanenii]|uniref:Uncharacterized protein n=1 Tax=Acidipropionibacterium virtanenii TaxID=2057246 RepID=A0A344UX43_9ACTN|nr:hypothetical protein JS278_02706 [Acidipropionibacterium virtanenii]
MVEIAAYECLTDSRILDALTDTDDPKADPHHE